MTEAPCSHYWLEVGLADPSEDWTEPGRAGRCHLGTPGRRTSGGRSGTTCWLWRPSSPRSRWRCWASPGWMFCGWGLAWSGEGGGREVCRAGTECSSEHRGDGGAWYCLALVYQADHWLGSLWTSSSHHNITDCCLTRSQDHKVIFTFTPSYPAISMLPGSLRGCHVTKMIRCFNLKMRLKSGSPLVVAECLFHC